MSEHMQNLFTHIVMGLKKYKAKRSFVKFGFKSKTAGNSWKGIWGKIFLFYIFKLEQTWACLNVLKEREQVVMEQLSLCWVWHTVDESIYKILSILIKCKMSWWILNSFSKVFPISFFETDFIRTLHPKQIFNTT